MSIWSPRTLARRQTSVRCPIPTPPSSLNLPPTLNLTLRGRQPSGALRRAYGLCAQLMHFFRQALLYMTFEVAEPAWRRFQAALAAAGTVDQVCMEAHSPWP